MPGITLAHAHLISPAIAARRGEEQFFAHGPEAQQTDAEFALQTLRAILLELPFYGIADVSGNILKIRHTLFISRNALPIVFYA